ncbi:MAG: flagellin, partial [Patescibacteria group bacterium]|nr:flagellin [Patescibacteria group bacterium]
MAIGDSTRINTNIAAFNALNALKGVNRNLEKSQLKLATGLRINEVADDPAGFTISRKLNARSRGLSVAYDNVGTTKNVLAIAEGGLLNISDILITMKEKVTQAASDTQGTAERAAIKSEIDQLT